MTPPRRTRDQLDGDDPRPDIPPEAIRRAIARIDRDGYAPHPDSTTYEVRAKGRKYPPLAIVAFALEDVLGRTIEPGRLRGGQGEWAFRVLADAGFTPVPKSSRLGDAEHRIADLLHDWRSIPDARRPGDAARRRVFRSGWTDATNDQRGDYTSETLSRLTWKNLGYRLGREFGLRDDDWIDAAFACVRSIWDGRYFAPTEAAEVLDQRADEYAELPDEETEAYVGSPTPPPRSPQPGFTFQRDPRVRGRVLRMAAGRCELCGQPAPFRKPNGHPYLEVHHALPLRDGGLDTTTNAVALCPNCHRRCHHASDAEAATAALYRRVDRLEPPSGEPRGDWTEQEKGMSRRRSAKPPTEEYDLRDEGNA